MKLIIALLIFIILGCSNPMEGLWIERNQEALLNFYGDSVINNTLNPHTFDGRYAYRRTKDTLTWIGVDPEVNNGKTENSFRYELTGDSLRVWYGSGKFSIVYFRTKAETYHDYFLKRDIMTLVLPRAEFARPTPAPDTGEMLDIKIGRKDRNVIIFVQDIETTSEKLEAAIRNFKNKVKSEDPYGAKTHCRLFVDERIPKEYTTVIMGFLKQYDIRLIYFMARMEDDDEFKADFYGVSVLIPIANQNLNEEAEAR